MRKIMAGGSRMHAKRRHCRLLQRLAQTVLMFPLETDCKTAINSNQLLSYTNSFVLNMTVSKVSALAPALGPSSQLRHDG